MGEAKPEKGGRSAAERVAELERLIEDLGLRMPAHSTPPGMMAELDELELALDQAQERLREETEAET